MFVYDYTLVPYHALHTLQLQTEFKMIEKRQLVFTNSFLKAIVIDL